MISIPTKVYRLPFVTNGNVTSKTKKAPMAPFLNASSTNLSPLKFGPDNAIKKSPDFIVLVSVDIFDGVIIERPSPETNSPPVIFMISFAFKYF